MNPRYLFAYNNLVEGDEDVFWGFLDDLRYLYHNKKSPFDLRFLEEDLKNVKLNKTPS